MVRRTVKAQVTAKSLIKDVTGLGTLVVNPAEVLNYLNEHPDLVAVVGRMAQEARRAIPDAGTRLELVEDTEDEAARTLILYLQPRQVDDSFFKSLDVWNESIANALHFSDAWFMATLDIRG